MDMTNTSGSRNAHAAREFGKLKGVLVLKAVCHDQSASKDSVFKVSKGKEMLPLKKLLHLSSLLVF